MIEQECIFCKIAKKPTGKSWEGKVLYSIFDLNPVNPGHSLIIPKRHVVTIEELNTDEWDEFNTAIKTVIGIIEQTDLKLVYLNMLASTESDITKWFLNKALSSQYLNTKPDAYNHGINDGREAGRTVDHLHWQIIPRYKGDVTDPRGGVRFVIPEMGNYKISR